MPTPLPRQRSTPAWRSPWFLGFVGLIVTVLAVNATMVYLAITTSPGLVNASYYERGQDYERSVLSRRAADPGWVGTVDVPDTARVGEPAPVRFAIVDRAGQPVVAERVDFYAYRPSDASQDFSATMHPEGRGRYRVEVAFPLIGVWDTLVAVRAGGEEQLIGERIRIPR